MTVDEALEYGRFEAWLKAHGEMAIGIPKVYEACPMAVYLRESTGAATVRVGRERFSCDGRRVDLPWWARRFVRAVDRCSAPLDGQQAANLLASGLAKGEPARRTPSPVGRLLNILRPAAL